MRDCRCDERGMRAAATRICWRRESRAQADSRHFRASRSVAPRRAPCGCRRTIRGQGGSGRRAARQSRHAGGDGYWPMRRYLSEFLSDRRVIERPRLVWQPILQGIVLSDPPAEERRALRLDLEPRAERIAAADLHALAGREARGGACRRGERRRRLGDALREAVDRRAADGAEAGRLRAHPPLPALSAIQRARRPRP